MVARIRTPEIGRGMQAEVEALLMSIGEGLIVTDGQARISRINKAALDILGFKEKELLGKWFPEAIVAEDQNGKILPVLERPIGQAFLTGKTVSARNIYRLKNGSKIDVSLTVSPVIVKGRPVGAIEVFRDISREIALERAKDEFVAIASHQLRTPATAVKQYVSLLLEGYAEPLTQEQRHFLERAFESNERQLQIVDEILKVTQLDLEKIILKPKTYDVRQIVDEAGDSLKSTFAAKHQNFIVKHSKAPVEANVDKDQLLIALENLLENASNYTHKGKNVVVITKNLKDKVKITIKDQGVGIEPKDFSRLFQKFSRIPNPLSVEVGGTGLGLYWAAKIVHLHGGYIDIKSVVGEGSEFSIIIPSDV